MSIPTRWASLPDWQRMVAQDLNPILQGRPPLMLEDAPSDPFEGLEYYDLTLHKKRTWDGSAWKNHW